MWWRFFSSSFSSAFFFGSSNTPDQVISSLGKGTFATVYACMDLETPFPHSTVAVKVIRNVKKYRDAAVIEIVVLDAIKAGDKDNSRYDSWIHSV
jgi:hypothetical protein